MVQFFRTVAAITLAIAASSASAGAQSPTVPATPSPMSASSADTTSMNPPENPLITARVTKEFLAWQRGKIDRSTYSPAAGGTYIDALVDVVAPDLRAIGTPQTTTYRTASLLLGDLVYRYDIIGANGTISVLYSLNQAGKTDGIAFAPQIFRPDAPTP